MTGSHAPYGLSRVDESKPDRRARSPNLSLTKSIYSSLSSPRIFAFRPLILRQPVVLDWWTLTGGPKRSAQRRDRTGLLVFVSETVHPVQLIRPLCHCGRGLDTVSYLGGLDFTRTVGRNAQ
jgi:hypothetical protein